MSDASGIAALLDSLAKLVEEAEGRRAKWRDVWGEVKSVGDAFKESRFPTTRDRQAAWQRFQSIIAHVKECQEKAKEYFDERVRISEYHLDQILSLAERATPSSESTDVVLTIFTGGLNVLIREGIKAILGPFDERKLELQRCNEVMKEGWAYLSKNKTQMLGRHKQEAFDALKKAQDRLTEAWDTWKEGRREAIERFNAEKQATWEERRSKREVWETKTRENIFKLEGRLDQLEEILDRRQSNLSRLEDMRDSAWSDSYRDRVSDWISEEHERISGIESKIDQIRGWISEMEAKLR